MYTSKFLVVVDDEDKNKITTTMTIILEILL